MRRVTDKKSANAEGKKTDVLYTTKPAHTPHTQPSLARQRCLQSSLINFTPQTRLPSGLSLQSANK